jgi:VanZ like family
MITIRKFFNGFAPAVLWWAFVLVLMCTPGKDLPKLGSWTELISLDKIIHIIIFSFMAYFFMRPMALRGQSEDAKKQTFLKIAIAIALWGLCTEFIQRFWVEGRSFDLWDVVADSIGAFAAFLYCKKHFFK